ncbi:MAG: aspartate aminotransferase family protein [Crocinitomicaceae bacterium]|nr:aspartate aminotransferase family protein [Crocinitomicaceae bacterium]
MRTYWSKRSDEDLKHRVFQALEENISYVRENVLGVPASYLDDKVFNQDASFLKDAPYISTLVQNPNHIGCHTLGHSESFFKGTQLLEKELIDVCSVDILKAKPDETDGYVASGGTEANIQAVWIYRNYFIKEFKAQHDEICVLCSEDAHYSMDKAADLLNVSIQKVKVDPHTREINDLEVGAAIAAAQLSGKKYFIVICNMMTTMFGSVDDINAYLRELHAAKTPFKLHVDGAFGGFYYPFSNDNSILTFENEHISSFTLDAHKMAQAPYGTGIFLIRKGMMRYAHTQSASYVEGDDFTLIGSRSGANAIAVWMILMKNGPFGWKEKIFILQKRAEWMCDRLSELGVEYYRNPYSNIITIKASFISSDIANEFGLVPDNHVKPNWYKIVIMEHVTVDKLLPLIERIQS